ncbi:unnamed protein product [Sympodiomycopsis kandeliae]
MARNQEKAQSMLYRFREAQAAELGISLGRSKDARRPRLASSVKDLRECERWRGDILREISRKVSKIQDFGLTDYEVRDLNDEINKLLREKSHWENQIIALGGANYKRSGRSMLDDGGKEVPGTRGYKYFGRAKDLPGVKELLSNASSIQESQEAKEERLSSKYRQFLNQPPSYLGDEDEDDGVLLKEEEERELESWKDKIEEIASELNLSPQDVESLFNAKELPRRRAENIKSIMSQQQEQQADQSQLLPKLLPALDSEQISTTNLDLPDRKSTEAFILRERKKMLKSEYLGAGDEK